MYKVGLEEILFSIALWLIAFLKYKSAFQLNSQGKGNYMFFLFIVAFYCVFSCTGGDFLHYRIAYENMFRGSPQYSLEDFYYNLILSLPHSYYLWRFVIWGLSTFVLVLSFKRLKCPPNITGLIFVLIIMEYFSAPRNTLGYVVLYYFLTFIIKPLNNKILSYLIAAAGIYLCTYLHKSMPLYIVIAFASFFSLKKWMYLLSFALFPVVYAAFRVISQYVLLLDFGSDSFADTGTAYLEGENFAATNLNGYISLILNRTPIIILLYYTISRVLRDEITNGAVVFFSRYSFWLIYISFIFYGQPTSSFLSPRFWDASIYPLMYAFPLAFYMKQEKSIVLGYKLLLVACSFNILHTIYVYL